MFLIPATKKSFQQHIHDCEVVIQIQCLFCFVFFNFPHCLLKLKQLEIVDWKMKVQFVWNLGSLYSWKTPFNQEFFHVILSWKPFYEVFMNFHPAWFYLGNFVNLFIYIVVLSFLLGFYSKSYFAEVAIETCIITLVVLRKAVLDCSYFETLNYNFKVVLFW